MDILVFLGGLLVGVVLLSGLFIIACLTEINSSNKKIVEAVDRLNKTIKDIASKK